MWQGSQLVSENWAGQELEFFYDESGSPYAFSYKASATATPVMYYYVTNLQGDVVNILDASGNIKASYTYNAWGEILSATGDIADINPLRYRGYYFDSDTGLYYLKARYYDPQLCRFINSDEYASTGQGILGSNMFAYCGNNPIMRVDVGGQEWWHWALGAAVVAGCAIATVITCGGFAAAVTAVGLVGSGIAAATPAATVASAAFVGASLTYGGAAFSAFLDSDSVGEFNSRGNWGTVAATAGGAAFYGGSAYISLKWFSQSPQITKYTSRGSTGRTQPRNLIEQLAMEQVKSNPSAGHPVKLIMNDPRWPASEGWIKMQQIVHTSQGDINIHYVYNQALRIFDDFKFIF